jgi:hypothetical protein
MAFVDRARKTVGRLALAAAVAGMASLTAAPGDAFARDGRHWRGHHGHHGQHHWRGHHRHHSQHWRGHHRHRGPDVALGLLGGALAGAAIAAATNPYYAYPNAYGYYPYYNYYYPY